MPKLLIINVALNWGSTGRIAEQVGALAKDDGWDVMIAHGARYQNPSEFDHYQVSTSLEEKVHWLISQLWDGQGRGSWCATRRFLKRIDSFKPNVVHMHVIHGYYMNYGLLMDYFKEKNIPVVWTLHDCWAFTGHCAYFTSANCEKWKTQCCKCPIPHDFPNTYLDKSKANYNRKKKVYGDMQNLVLAPVSQWLGDLVKESFLGKHDIQVVYNGIDVDVFKPSVSNFKEKLGIEGKYLLLGVAQGFDERKGLKDFFKLSEMLPDDYQVVLLGAMEDEIAIAPKSVIALPKTESLQELVEAYSAADVLLSLSYEETFGLTPVEAMACGTPAIVYNNTAQPEHITPETGFVVENGDLDTLVARIKILCETGKATYSSACRERAVNVYDKDKCYRKYIDLFTSLILNK